jgi:uncharacterized protein YbbK (DUF523 family)
VKVMQQILVSSCLLGRPVRYDGRAKTSDSTLLAQWQAEGRLITVCPELSGGLSVPRPPAEISQHPADPGQTTANDPGGTVLGRTRANNPGRTVFGRVTVLTVDGADVTASFERGAEVALETARRYGIRMAILKEGSPSCGSNRIYDGTFTGTSVPGSGITAALLTSHGIRVFSEAEIPAAASYLAHLEETTPA